MGFTNYWLQFYSLSSTLTISSIGLCYVIHIWLLFTLYKKTTLSTVVTKLVICYEMEWYHFYSVKMIFLATLKISFFPIPQLWSIPDWFYNTTNLMFDVFWCAVWIRWKCTLISSLYININRLLLRQFIYNFVVDTALYVFSFDSGNPNNYVHRYLFFAEVNKSVHNKKLNLNLLLLLHIPIRYEKCNQTSWNFKKSIIFSTR